MKIERRRIPLHKPVRVIYRCSACGRFRVPVLLYERLEATPARCPEHPEATVISWSEKHDMLVRQMDRMRAEGMSDEAISDAVEAHQDVPMTAPNGAVSGRLTQADAALAYFYFCIWGGIPELRFRKPDPATSAKGLYG
jgi:hypothetical protein